MNRKPPTEVRGLEVAPLGEVQYIEGAIYNMSQVYHKTSLILQPSSRRVKPTAGIVRGENTRHNTLAGAFDRRDLKPTLKQDRAGCPTGREIQGLETAKNLCRTAIANVSNGVNRHAPGGKDYMYSLLKRSLDFYTQEKVT